MRRYIIKATNNFELETNELLEAQKVLANESTKNFNETFTVIRIDGNNEKILVQGKVIEPEEQKKLSDFIWNYKEETGEKDMKNLKKMNLYFFREINKFYEDRTFLPKRLDKMFYDKTDEEVLNLKFSIDDAIVIANRALEFEREMFDNQYERQYEYLDADLKFKRKYFELFSKDTVDLKTIDTIVDMVISCGGDDFMIMHNLKKQIKK